MLRACCERAAKMLRTWFLATFNIRSLFSSSPCCDYIGAMLRLVLRATSNIRSLFSLPLDTTSNIKCLQHRNATSATLKINGYNIQHHEPSSTQHPTSHICNIKTQHPHTSKINVCNINIFRSNFETFTENTRNMSKTRMQHVHNN
jgi:hypothetical protein